MEDLQLYCIPAAYYSQKAAICLEEKFLKYETVALNMANGENIQPWFLKMNPKGQVPVLKHGDKVIPDSQKIAEYLEATFDTENKLIPADISTEEGIAVRYICESCSAVIPRLITFGLQQFPDLFTESEISPESSKGMIASIKIDASPKLLKLAEENPDMKEIYLAKAESMSSAKMDRESVVSEIEKVKCVLNDVETRLRAITKGKQEESWITGPAFTVADIDIAILMRRMKKVGLAKSTWLDGKHPCLETYYTMLQNRPSFKKICL